MLTLELTFGVNFWGYFKWRDYIFSFSGQKSKEIAKFIFDAQAWFIEGKS